MASDAECHPGGAFDNANAFLRCHGRQAAALDQAVTHNRGYVAMPTKKLISGLRARYERKPSISHRFFRRTIPEVPLATVRGVNWPMCPGWLLSDIASATLTPADLGRLISPRFQHWTLRAGRRLLRPRIWDRAHRNAAHASLIRPAPANQNARMAPPERTPITGKC